MATNNGITVNARSDKRAEIRIYEPIGEGMFTQGITATWLAEQLDSLGDVSDIDVRINSPGGSVFDGIAIHNILKQHKAQVTVYIDGIAASIASVIAMAADLIVMPESSEMMVHDPWTVSVGNSDDHRKVAETLDTIKESMVSAYVSRTGLTRDAVAKIMSDETWLTSEKAIELGFADVAVKTETAKPENASAWAPYMRAMKRHEFPNLPQVAAMLPTAAAVTTKEVDMTAPTISAADAEKIRTDALAAEANRRAQIRALFNGRNLPDVEAKCLDDMQCDEVKAMRELIKQTTTATPTDTSVSAGVDESEKFVAGASAALLARGGLQKPEQGNQYSNLGVKRIGELCLQRAGISTRNMSDAQMFERLTKIRASHTTSDFPLLLSNTANKALRNGYDRFPSTWRTWCDIGNVPDFKSNSRIQLGTLTSLTTKLEGAPIEYGTFGEESESIQALTKAIGLMMSREMFINDDLGGFLRRSVMAGNAVARTVNADAYGRITSNPTMSDTGALFNTTAQTTAGGHGNLSGSNDAITVASISAGRAVMRKQRDSDLRDYLNLQPRYLLAPVAKEHVALKVMGSIADVADTNANAINVVRGYGLTLVTDPLLDAASTTAWYLVADPMDAALVEVCFLDGVQNPFTEEVIDFDTDAVKFKVRLDYGFAAIDWRAGYKNTGA